MTELTLKEKQFLLRCFDAIDRDYMLNENNSIKASITEKLDLNANADPQSVLYLVFQDDPDYAETIICQETQLLEDLEQALGRADIIENYLIVPANNLPYYLVKPIMEWYEEPTEYSDAYIYDLLDKYGDLRKIAKSLDELKELPPNSYMPTMEDLKLTKELQ